MKKGTIIAACLTCLLVAYIAIVVPMTIKAERDDTFRDLRIVILDDKKTGFLTSKDINEAIGDLAEQLDTLKRKNLNTYRLERQINALSRVEKAQCNILNNGTLVIQVDPFDPIARVFDRDGSVYVNADGKRVPTRLAYHIDVPVITTETVADTNMVHKLLPVLRAIKTDERANALVSSLHIDRRGDIIIIPNVVGHVINFGDSTLIDNKLERLHVFYRDVMPVRGWNAFDTISVKWNGRIVATKRDKSQPEPKQRDEVDGMVNDIPMDV